MSSALAILLVLHGLIHLTGFAKAFGYADLPALTEPISRPGGALWLAAALLFVAAAVALFAWPRWWWAVGAVAVTISTVVILQAWTDAKYGALVNLIVLVAVAFGFLARGPVSLRAQYDRDVLQGIARTGASGIVTAQDLDRLPGPVARYLRLAGTVGQPRVQNVRARMHGRIRRGPDAPWMPFKAEQHNFLDEPSRFFYLTASRVFVPIQGLHRYAGSAATMRVLAAAVVPVAVASGPEMTRAETVTLFNDMCVLAPATLIDPSIAWEPLDDRTVRASYTTAGHTVRAELSFNEAGELVDFQSGDRRQAGAGGEPRQVHWSTPLRGYRAFGPVRLAAEGEGRWHEPGGAYAYIELTIDDVEYNVRR